MIKKSIVLALIFVFVITFCGTVSAAPGDTIYVNDSGDDSYDGYSWLTAKKTIKNATVSVNEKGTIYIANGEYKGFYNTNITVNKSMNIIGQNQEDTIINGNGTNCIFRIHDGINITLINLTLQNGTSGQGHDDNFGGGGAIYNYIGNLNISNCNFINNSAIGVNNKNNDGGGAIYNYIGNLNISNCNFINNTVNEINNHGGAIFDFQGNLNISNCNFTNNNANNDVGGAIFATGSNLNVRESVFCSNKASYGGAIYKNFSMLIIKNSTFTNNTGTSRAGAIYNDGDILIIKESTFNFNFADNGGAIYNSGNLTVNESIFTNNRVNSNGGAISGYISNLTVINSSFSDNTAGSNGGALFISLSNMTIMNSIFDNNNAKNQGGAIVNNYGNLTVINSSFINNFLTNSRSYGGAIYSYSISNLTIINSTFTIKSINPSASHGGAIYNDDNSYLTMINSTFNNNKALTKGGAIYSFNHLILINSTCTNNTAKWGGAIYTYHNASFFNSTFINNTAELGGAISNSGTIIYNITKRGFLNVIGSIFDQNTALNGSSIYNSYSLANVSFSCFLDNSLNSIYNTLYDDNSSDPCTFNASSNWWGSNNSPLDIANITIDNWLVMSIIADPVCIYYGENSTITIDLLHDNTGTYHDPTNAHLLDGIPVNFAINGVKTFFTVLINGEASMIYTANTTSMGNITATINNQEANIINKLPTYISIMNLTGNAGQNATLFANIKDYYNNTVMNGLVEFKINNTSIGRSNVNNGTASIKWTIPSQWTKGDYNIVVEYLDNNQYLQSNNTGILKLNTTYILDLNSTIYKKEMNISEYTLFIYKLSNHGPDAADNITISFNLPFGLDFISSAISNGSFYYNTNNRIGNWYLNNITTTDYYLYLTLNPSIAGNYSINVNGTNAALNRTDNIFVFDNISPTAYANVKSGLYNTNKAVSLSMSEIGNIYYTINSATPTNSSTKYTGPITIASTVNLKFIAFDNAGNPSPVYTATYTIDKTAPKLISTYPKRYATRVSRTSTMYIKFSEKLKASVNWSKIVVKNKYGKAVSISKWISNNVLYIKTSSKRSSYSYYTIYIPASAIKDYAGNNFAGGYSIKFKTGR